MSEGFMTLQEATKIIGCSERTVRRWLTSGKLQGCKVGIPGLYGRWSIHRDELERFLYELKEGGIY